MPSKSILYLSRLQFDGFTIVHTKKKTIWTKLLYDTQSLMQIVGFIIVFWEANKQAGKKGFNMKRKIF